MSKISSLLQVSEDEIKAVREVYVKTEDSIKQDLDILKDWLKKQPHLPHTDDNLLERILLRNKFRLEKTKQKIDKYYTLRGLHADFFKLTDFNSQRYINSRKCQMFIILPKLTPSLERIFIFKLIDTDPEIFNVPDSCSYFLSLVMLCTYHDYAKADHFILDWEGFSFSHFKKMEPNTVAKFFALYTQAFSARVAHFHYINNPSFIDAMKMLFKPLLKAKIFNKVVIHKDFESLYEYLPRENLPIEYGGTERTMAEINNDWSEELRVQKNFFDEQAKKVSDESKRIGESAYSTDLYGVDGSFKKLNLD